MSVEILRLEQVAGFAPSAISHWKKLRLQKPNFSGFPGNDEISILCDPKDDPKVLAEQALRILLNLEKKFPDRFGRFSIACPSHALSPIFCVFATPGSFSASGNFLFANFVSRRANFSETVLVDFKLSELDELTRIIFSQEFSEAGNFFSSKDGAQHAYRVCCIAALSQGLTELPGNFKNLAATVGISSYPVSSDFVNFAVTRELLPKWKDASFEKLISVWLDLLASNAMVVEAPVDNWIQCDACDKWRLLAPDMIGLLQLESFKCDDLQGVDCGTECDSVRFNQS